MNTATKKTMTRREAPAPDFTVDDAAKKLNCHRASVYRMIADGKLVAYTIGRARRITTESIEALRHGATA